MPIQPRAWRRRLLPTCALLLSLSAVWTLAQTQRAARTGTRSPQAQPGPLRFGDVILYNFERAEIILNERVRVIGPNTTVDADDPKQNRKGRLQAREIIAYMADKSNAVERIEAVGNVRFEGSRPLAQREGPQIVRASGSKAVYEKIKQRLTLEGPVNFYAEEPTSDGKGKQSVRGTASSATYDEEKRLLALSGSVDARVFTPQTPPEGASFSGDAVTMDMGKSPYRIQIDNTSGRGRVSLPIRAPEEEKRDKKP
jgi:lipopolysaccharide export system protein LptA